VQQPLICGVFTANLTCICREFAVYLPQILSLFTASLPHICCVFIANLSHVCWDVAACLQLICRLFAGSLLHILLHFLKPKIGDFKLDYAKYIKILISNNKRLNILQGGNYNII
jgi:hypothetical protein